MPNIRLVIEYDGSRFHGWQFQPGLRTVEGELLQAIRTVLREPVRSVSASGRTDAGVHARGQVVNFKTNLQPDLHRLKHAISSVMREDLSVISADIVPDEFHSTRSAKRKQYSYTIFNRTSPPILDRSRVWFVPMTLDIERMKREANVLIGEHDFKSFQCQGCNARTTIKEIYQSELEWCDPYLYYRVVGSGFLKQMVRSIVGTLVMLGRGRSGSPDTKERLGMKEIVECRDRRRAGMTAPAYGLCLDWVEY